jgi:hypothetical protein
VRPDPRRGDVAVADLEASFELSVRIQELLQRTHGAIARLRSVREQAAGVLERATAAEAPESDSLREQVDALTERLTAIEEVLIQTKAEARQDPINFPPMLDTQIGYLYRYVAFTYGRPGQPAYDRFENLARQVQGQETELETALGELVPALNDAVRTAGLGGIVLPR